MSPGDAPITVSIVSHGHGPLISLLLSDLAQCCGSDIQVLLTLNVPEDIDPHLDRLGIEVTVIRNLQPMGFGANHNAAFHRSHSPYFCILNPDIRITGNPFPTLIRELDRPRTGVVAPLIVNPEGKIEDSARSFPTIGILARKAFARAEKLDYEISDFPLSPDWVAGMFMLFRSEIFAEIGCFDERYFLYYEDVDLCRRLRRRGYDVRLVPTVAATHDARRASRRNLRHLRWHLASAFRFLTSN